MTSSALRSPCSFNEHELERPLSANLIPEGSQHLLSNTGGLSFSQSLHTLLYPLPHLMQHTLATLYLHFPRAICDYPCASSGQRTRGACRNNSSVPRLAFSPRGDRS